MTVFTRHNAEVGFSKKWIERMMTCVTTTSFSILLNGKPYGNVLPSRGIRQGDLLSPYLFLLCAEGFTSLLAKAENDGKIHGASICRGASKVSNLLFADDSLLFCKATRNKVEVISKVLQTYANASRLCINLEKSSVFFSSHTSASQKQDILRSWEFSR